MKREARISRRSFLNNISKVTRGAILGSLPIITAGCKPSASGPDDPIDRPVKDIIVKITFYNQTQGSLGERTYNGKSNEKLSLRIQELGFAGIDPSRIALRQAADSQTMGSFVGFSRNGTLSVDYPDSDQNWEGYLLNDRPDSVDLYQFVDSEIDWGAGYLQHGRNITWSRTDFGATGPDEPILQILDQFNQALMNPWKKYGSLIKVDSGARIRAGYGPLPTAPYPYEGWGGNLVVDPERCPTLEDILDAFMDASFRAITFTGKKDGKQPHEYICDQPGLLNQAGRDMLCYCFVKDQKY